MLKPNFYACIQHLQQYVSVIAYNKNYTSIIVLVIDSIRYKYDCSFEVLVWSENVFMSRLCMMVKM